MRNENKQQGFVNIGTSLLMVVFLSISLVTFAVLALSSAKTDMNFSENLAAHRSAYYEADSKAHIIYGKLEEILLGDEAPKLEDLELEGIVVTFDKENSTFSYSIPVDEKSRLSVSLRPTETGCDIVFWQLQASEPWVGDDSIELLPIGD